MKKYFITMWILAALLEGCEQSEIIFYNQEPRLDFEGYSDVGNEKKTILTEFNDVDYLNQVTEKTDSVDLLLIGHLLSSPLTYCLTTEKDTSTNLDAEIRFASEYTHPAGVFVSWAKFVVKRPELCRKSYKTNIVFDTQNPAFQFSSGRVEAAKMGYMVEFNLEPIEGWSQKLWNADFLGIYSNGKYKFIIDTYKKVYRNLVVNADFKNDVRAKYAAYKAAGGVPILDDEDEPEEIVFPQ